MNLRKKLVSFATWIGLKDKSGWDIITDLSLPLAIFIGGSAFTYMMNAQSQANSEEALKDSILSGYLESMRQTFSTSDDPRLKDPASLRKVIAARALTLTALNRLSSERDETDKVGSNKRKGVIIKFLWEFGLIEGSPPIISLRGANLRGTDLKGESLSRKFRCAPGVRFSNAIIRNDPVDCTKANVGINLYRVDLRRSSLASSDLGGADLSSANLSDADLSHSMLQEADLEGAKLLKTNLYRTSLINSNLAYANLQQAKLDHAELDGARLDHANLTGTPFHHKMSAQTREFWEKTKDSSSR
jgi:hypothetical protein